MMGIKEILMVRTALVAGLTVSRGIPTAPIALVGCMTGTKETLMARSAWVVYMMGIKEILMVRTAPGGSVFEPLERSIRQSYRQKILKGDFNSSDIQI